MLINSDLTYTQCLQMINNEPSWGCNICYLLLIITNVEWRNTSIEYSITQISKFFYYNRKGIVTIWAENVHFFSFIVTFFTESCISIIFIYQNLSNKQHSKRMHNLCDVIYFFYPSRVVVSTKLLLLSL